MTAQKSYYRVMLGQKHKHAKECYEGKFIGVHDDGIFGDLFNHLPEDRKVFIEKFRSKFLERNPNKKKGAVTRACGICWTICKGIEEGDIVLCPNGKGIYWVGKVISGYSFQTDNDFFPHQRKVAWFSEITRAEMSLKLQKTTGTPHTYVNLTKKYAKEIEELIAKTNPSL